jgi:hypothetical protein
MGLLAKDANKLAGIGLVKDMVKDYALVANDSITLDAAGESDMFGLSFEFNREALGSGLLDKLKTSKSLKELLEGSKSHGTS